MIHGLKVSITPGTARRRLLKQDETLAATASTLSSWHDSLKSLGEALDSNQQAWQTLFSSYNSFHSAAKDIYPPKDTIALESLQLLSLCQKRLESLSDSSDNCQSPYQRVEAAKKELSTLIIRVTKAQQLHQNRMQTLRQLAYYRRKLRQLEATDAKRKSPPNQKDAEKLDRTRSKIHNIDTQLTTTVENLFSEMEQIDIERLAVTDRAAGALVILQTHHFRAAPVLDALNRTENVGFARRTLPRNDSRPWLPSDRQTAHLISSQSNTLDSYTSALEEDPSVSATSQPELYSMPTAPPMSQPHLDVYASPPTVGRPPVIDPPRIAPLAPTAATTNGLPPSSNYYATAAAELLQQQPLGNGHLTPTSPDFMSNYPQTPTAPTLLTPGLSPLPRAMDAREEDSEDSVVNTPKPTTSADLNTVAM